MNAYKAIAKYCFQIYLFCFALIANANDINLTAQVDRTSLSINESLRLVVAVNESATDSIDFSQLTSQFEIVNQQRSQRQQIINSKVNAMTQWILVLAPLETGNLLIPSFRYQDVFSNPIEITVSHSITNQTDSRNDVFLEITADKTQAYVQEQVLLKTRLYYKISLSSYEAPEFTIKDTNIELINETSYKTSVNNQRYQVLELIHALYPQASGELLIPPFRWRLEKPSRGFFDRSGNPYLFVQSNPLNLTIKPIPDKNTALDWLPAKAVTLDAQWQQSPLQAKVGEPLNLTVTLTANGLSAAQLPPITITDHHQLQIFSEPSAGDNVKSGNGIIGSQMNEFAIIPQQTGSIELPEINIKWWNVTLGKEQIATLPPQRIVVGSSQLKQEPLPDLPALETMPNSLETTTSTHASFWQAMSLLLSIFCAALCYWIYHLKQLSTRHSNQETYNDEIASLANTEEKIEHAIKSDQFNRLPTLLIQWGRQFYGNAKIQRCDDLVNYLPSIEEDINALNRLLYSDKPMAIWQPKNLIKTLKSAKRQPQPLQEKNLKPLYPQ